MYQRHHDFRLGDPFLTYYVFTAGVIHACNMSSSAPSSAEAASEKVAQCAEALQQMQTRWGGASKQGALLSSLGERIEAQAHWAKRKLDHLDRVYNIRKRPQLANRASIRTSEIRTIEQNYAEEEHDSLASSALAFTHQASTQPVPGQHHPTGFASGSESTPSSSLPSGRSLTEEKSSPSFTFDFSASATTSSGADLSHGVGTSEFYPYVNPALLERHGYVTASKMPSIVPSMRELPSSNLSDLFSDFDERNWLGTMFPFS